MAATAVLCDSWVIVGLRLRTLRALGLIRAVVASVATDRRHRGVAHRIGREARRRIGVAVAALNCAGRNVRRGRVARSRGSVVAAYAVGVRRLVNIRCARPTGEIGGGGCVADLAILATRRNVTGIRCRPVGAFRSLTGENAIVARVAAAAADRRMSHRVAGEACRRIGMAIAALNRPGRDVRRRRHAGCRRPVVASRTVGVGDLVHVSAARPAGETRRRAGVTGDTVAATRRDMTGIRRGAVCALRAFARV